MMNPSEQAQTMTLERIAAAMGGSIRLPSGAASSVSPPGYSIDSRTLKAGDLFFAIVGPHHDGHRFLAGAAGRGAAAVVVSRPEAAAELAVPAIVVTDTLRALQDLAGFVRRSLPARVVAITGSAGKTTTKEMTRQALQAAFQVHASRGNLNNLYGCPLAILETRPEHQVSVLEMGMSYHGELKRLAEIADPDIGVLTNVAGAHMAHFRDLDDVADAKGELFAGMRDNSTGIFNNDDERCRRIMDRFRGYAFTFGVERTADLTASDYEMDGLESAAFTARHAHNGGTRKVRVTLRFPGRHHVYNALAALSAGYMLGIDLEGMAAQLARLEPLGMRGRVLRLKEAVRLVDDCYNSNPAAMRSAIQLLSEAAPSPGGRRVLVMGDMLELGAGEVEAHREIGRSAAASGADVIVGVGPLAREAVLEAQRSRGGGAPLLARALETAGQAAPDVASLIQPGDLVLVKGSRGVALETIVAAIRDRFGEE